MKGVVHAVVMMAVAFFFVFLVRCMVGKVAKVFLPEQSPGAFYTYVT